MFGRDMVDLLISDMASYICFSEVFDENMYVLNIWFGWMSKMIRC